MCRIGSYQYGFDDTLLVVADGDVSLWDVNDCKIRGKPLRKIVKQFGRPDIALKSHSFAQGYPNCYTADDPRDLGRITKQTFIDDFCEAIDEIQPGVAVPFASMVGFLHPETRHCNEFLVTPPEVKAAYEATHPGVTDRDRDDGAGRLVGQRAGLHAGRLRLVLRARRASRRAR